MKIEKAVQRDVDGPFGSGKTRFQNKYKAAIAAYLDHHLCIEPGFVSLTNENLKELSEISKSNGADARFMGQVMNEYVSRRFGGQPIDVELVVLACAAANLPKKQVGCGAFTV